MNTTPIIRQSVIRLEPTNEFTSKCNELVEWAKFHDGDVDPTAFHEACVKLALVTELRKLPRSVKGCELLDIIDCLYGTNHGRFLASIYRGLPGAKRLRDSDEGHEFDLSSLPSRGDREDFHADG